MKMVGPNKESIDKIKLLDQMLEDMAGDEIEDYAENYSSGIKANFRQTVNEDEFTLNFDEY